MTNDFINRQHLSTQDRFKYEIPGLYISVGVDSRNNQFYIYFKTKNKESLEYIGEEL